ncbi:hypothetical protein GCM10009608_63950 [Pseudonocardia alaniniphila]
MIIISGPVAGHDPVLDPEPVIMGTASRPRGRRARAAAGDITGQPVSIACVLRFDDGNLADIVACARPWSAALALYSRIKGRLGEELGPEYFWAAQPDYESYL